MYIRTTRNSAGQTYYHLVEACWENGQSRQRTLLSLGKADDNRLDDLVTALARHKEEIEKNLYWQDRNLFNAQPRH